MIQLETLTACRAVSSEGLIDDARQAIDDVLGEGAVDFSASNGGNLDLVSEEELAVIQRTTGALGELSVPDLIEKTAEFMPDSFKSGYSPWLYLPQVVTINGLRGRRREMVLTLSGIKKHKKERSALTGAYNALTGENINWQKFVPGVKLGTVAEDAKPTKDELKEVKRRMPASAAKLQRGKAERTKIPAG